MYVKNKLLETTITRRYLYNNVVSQLCIKFCNLCFLLLFEDDNILCYPKWYIVLRMKRMRMWNDLQVLTTELQAVSK